MGPSDMHLGGAAWHWAISRQAELPPGLRTSDGRRMDPPAGADSALGSAAQKAAGEAQAQSMSTRGFVNPGAGSNTPDSTNMAPVAGKHTILLNDCALCMHTPGAGLQARFLSIPGMAAPP